MFMYGGAQYVMRLDGFISVNAGYEKGEFVTRPATFSGSTLEINYSTAGAGEIHVELLGADGKPIPGFLARRLRRDQRRCDRPDSHRAGHS